MNNTAMDVYNCLRLIELCIENGVLTKDENPDNEEERKNNVVLYCRTEEHGEGWYSVNIPSAARDLADDLDGQNGLIEALADLGIAFVATETPSNFNVVYE